MIARNDRNQIKKRLAKQGRQTAAHQRRLAQSVLNGVLWQIIKGKAHGIAEDAGEEFDVAAESVLSIPLAAVKTLPDGYALRVVHNKDTIDIIAGLVKPKSDILLADGSNAASG